MENYLVVLFKDKVRYKILKKYITFKKAKNYFEDLKKESESVIFEKKIVEGYDTKFEIGLVEKSSTQLVPVYITDEMGRNVKVKLENDGMTLIEISIYKMEEELYDLQETRKIGTKELIKKYLKSDGVKMISSLNNKIIIQNDDEVYLFSTKNSSESERFLNCLSNHFYSIKRKDCLFVKDISVAQKKYLYSFLKSKGFDKKILYRKFTTYPRQVRLK
jgi:hypothetical protein